MTLTVAVAQFAAALDKQENLKLVREGIRVGADRGARLVVTPEYGMYNDATRSSSDRSYPEPLDGPWLNAVRETVRELGVHAVVGIAESLPGESRNANTVVALDASGEIAGVYRKIHLYDAFGFRESDTVLPADIVEPLIFDLGDLRFGVLTCYDLRFPESARVLVDAGANALVLPAAWVVGPAKEDHWSTLVRARAIENTSYVLAAGQTGPHCAGQSMIVDPMGVTLASAGEAPGVALAELTESRLESVRERNPSLRHRRFKVVPA
ncbi:carbon-nitrogen hydrolase family protein [Amycolatopsis nigrescens]|uniref:carbon-nitrogen hydrolase family protein n=1 Tax=Amycolatopsis nigrescens TaxID=381445 RepID=UPI00035F53F7|nr:carbon-nitrogen hydrolase family protein [Amycolatopsis nigrescens]